MSAVRTTLAIALGVWLLTGLAIVVALGWRFAVGLVASTARAILVQAGLMWVPAIGEPRWRWRR